MRIVIDMQGAQTESRFRGIGRYTLSFAQAVARNRGNHEVFLALNGLFPETIEPIRAAFYKLLPQTNIRVWGAPGPVRESDVGNNSRRDAAELLREAFLASLCPDIIHIPSLFEGFIDDAVASIGRFDNKTPVSVTLHDLIPLSNQQYYLDSNLLFKDYYLRKIDFIKRATIYFAVSDFSLQEGVTHLGRPVSCFTNTAEAVDPCFRPQSIDKTIYKNLADKFNIDRQFILYTGGADERKNLPRLIEAYGTLPTRLRNDYKLLFAGKMPDGDVSRLCQIAHDAGVTTEEFTFTGYITDEELIQLYNLCALYIFPSWSEGFGLPALEAMACGAPVIGSNTASLPEVIDWDAAYFDPFDIKSIAAKITHALEDETFRKQLRSHGLKQAKKFSWDKTALVAIEAWERLRNSEPRPSDYRINSLSANRLASALATYDHLSDDNSLLALSSCLAKNKCSGIERQLLLDVSELSQRDAATGVQRVVRSYLKWLLQNPPSDFRIEPVYATLGNGYCYARNFTCNVLGNAAAEVFDEPIRWQRGDLFFGLDMQHHVQLANEAFYNKLMYDGVIVKFLVYDLLPVQLPNYFKNQDAKDLHERWLGMIANTDGMVCISEATAQAFTWWVKEKGIILASSFQLSWVHIGSDISNPQSTQSAWSEIDTTILQPLRRRITFLCVSTIEPRKQQQQILEAVEQLWQQGLDINLVFVGQPGWKTEPLVQRLRDHAEHGLRLFWLAGIDDEYLEKIYASSTCLIAASLGEGFGLSLIEAARHGLPIIARDIPVFREVAGKHAYYFKGTSTQDLAAALLAWLGLYKDQQNPSSVGMPWVTWQQSTEKLKIELTEQHYPRRQLLVDISELVQRDVGTGIQRVVRSILAEWLDNPPEGYRIEPIYATTDRGYCYARRFKQNFTNAGSEQRIADETIDYSPGDIFFGLDFQPQIVVKWRPYYQELRRSGVVVKFMVYDLLSVQMPQHFPRGNEEGFTQWLKVVAESDGAICISKSVSDDLHKWIRRNGNRRERPFVIDWSHIGADIGRQMSTHGYLENAKEVLNKIKSKISFLIVGTIEPRKGHYQIFSAFELLWQTKADVNLVIVGKQGWMMESLMNRIQNHPELNKHLFLLEGISDEYLEEVYVSSSCLIAASYGEGFGLPLIEAAQHGLPIIARDIAVYREVTGNHAYFFEGDTAGVLADAISRWISLFISGDHPNSNDLKWSTWKESAQRLVGLLLSSDRKRAG